MSDTIRTPEEIVARIEVMQDDDDLTGTGMMELVARLPFSFAKPYLNDNAVEDGWTPLTLSREDLLARMLDYMPFAWGKVQKRRGLSANRSMAHFSAWVWLLGDDLGDLMDYDDYGRANLIRICNHYGWDYSQWEN